MLLIIFSILDTKTGAFGRPQFELSDASAIRSFSDEVNSSEKNNLTRHPEDYALYRLGSFDTSTGEIIPEMTLKNLATASALVAVGNPELPFNGNGVKVPSVVS